jgi:hypothetical protein
LTPLGGGPVAGGLTPLGPDPLAGLAPLGEDLFATLPPPNPYAAPIPRAVSAGSYSAPAPKKPTISDFDRRGLPWERDPSLEALIESAQQAGYWKLVSRIFPENRASLALVRSLGFREVGTYEKHGKLDGIWRDVVIVERLIDANLTA